MIEFPDMPHINLLVDKLWKGREYGQATVMVGAGFSRNAESDNPSAPLFPSWSDLGKSMYRVLYPTKTTFDQQYLENEISAISGDGVLKLGDEYEKSFGRTGLDSMLRNLIPDSQYQPGRLHKLLMQLPWADVFTTNYDTLLERTSVVNKNYCIVTTHEDIPGSTKPRIVKLHGSFPSNRPFIFTEEDYRTYPAKHAPFVNMVQQSLMETTFCLIGFSASDPNFLHWIGWVRDHLNTAALKIYLCGILDISIAKRRVLESKNIIPINLSSLFPTEKYPENIRHAAALEWFLLTLTYGAPTNKYTWPDICTDIDEVFLEQVKYKLPDIPTKNTFHLINIPIPNFISEHISDSLAEELVNNWWYIRKQYPGWVICPKDNRDAIWRNTEAWLDIITDDIIKLSPPLDLFLIYELNWRLELTLTPIADPWAEVFSKVVERYVPIESKDIDGTYKILLTSEDYKHLDWSRIKQCWISILFALLRKYREERNIDSFNSTFNKIKDASKQDHGIEMRLHYEKCLFHLIRFDINELEDSLKTWDVNNGASFWKIRKAALLFEFGFRDEATALTETALRAIRASQNIGEDNFSLISQEGWAMILAEMSKEGFLYHFHGYRNRLEKLRINKVDPWNEFEAIKTKLLSEPPKIEPEIKEEIDFHPNIRSITHHYSGRPLYYDIRPAYSLIRLYEEGGVPFGSVAQVDRAANWIKDIDFMLAITLLIRNSSTKVLKQWFDRVTVAVLPSEIVDCLANWLIGVLQNLIERYENKPDDLEFKRRSFVRKLIEPVLIVLSRLAFRLKKEQLFLLFDLCETMSKSPIYRNNLRLDPVGELLKCIIQAFSPKERLNYLERFLTLPVPGWAGFNLQIAEDWPEPFMYKEMWEIESFKHNYTSYSLSEIIGVLIEMTGSNNKHIRRRGILRMLSLHKLGILSSEQKTNFESKLWAYVEENTGLPANTGLPYFNFISFSDTVSFDIKELLKNHLLNLQNPPDIAIKHKAQDIHTHEPMISSRLLGEYLFELKGASTALFPSGIPRIEWTMEEAERLLEITSIYWDTYKSQMNSEIPFFNAIDDWSRAFISYLDVLALVILPRLSKTKTTAKKLSVRLINEMHEAGLPVHIVAPSLLFLCGMKISDVSSLLKEGFFSENENVVTNTIIGLFYWMGFSLTKKISPPPKYLLDELINMIIVRREPGLGSAIAQMTIIVEKLDVFLSDKNIKGLLFALDILRSYTALPSYDELNDKDVNLLKRPNYRGWSAVLAYKLHQYLSKNGKEIPKVINEWKNICITDPLPEVRYAWQSYE